MGGMGLLNEKRQLFGIFAEKCISPRLKERPKCLLLVVEGLDSFSQGCCELAWMGFSVTLLRAKDWIEILYAMLFKEELQQLVEMQRH